MSVYVIKYHNLDDGKHGEIVFEARDDKHARRLAQARMNRKPYAASFRVERHE